MKYFLFALLFCISTMSAFGSEEDKRGNVDFHPLALATIIAAPIFLAFCGIYKVGNSETTAKLIKKVIPCLCRQHQVYK